MLTDWLMVIITGIYVVATILICIYNGKSAEAAKEQTEVARMQIDEMINQYNSVNRPQVTIRFDVIRSGLLCFVIENEGPLPARDVRININQEFISNIKDLTDRNCLEEMNKGVFYLASRQKMTILLGGQPSFSDIAKEIAKFNITYNGFNEHVEIDINQYRFLLLYNSPVEDISQHLKKIKESEGKFQKDIIKAISKPPQIQNVVVHSATEEDANKFRIYKLVCMESHLTYVQIAQKLLLEQTYTFRLLKVLCEVDRLVAYTYDDFNMNDENALWFRR